MYIHYKGRTYRNERLEHIIYLQDLSERYPDLVKGVADSKKEIKCLKFLLKAAKERYKQGVEELQKKMKEEASDTDSYLSDDMQPRGAGVEKRQKK